MTREVPPRPQAIVARALVGSSVAVLVMGLILNSQGQTAGGPEALSWVAVAWALLAPLVAVAVRGRGLVASAEEPRTPEQASVKARQCAWLPGCKLKYRTQSLYAAANLRLVGRHIDPPNECAA